MERLLVKSRRCFAKILLSTFYRYFPQNKQMTFFSPRGVLVFVYKYGINMKARKILLVFLILYGGYVSAQEVRDSVKIYFRQGYSVLEPSRRNNKEALDRIADSLRTSYADSVYQLKRIQVVGGASPAGSITLNRHL